LLASNQQLLIFPIRQIILGEFTYTFFVNIILNNKVIYTLCTG